MKDIQVLLDKLEGIKRTRDGEWMALCPAHPDRVQSLSVKEVPGKILLTCHAGCATIDILKALDLTMADLFTDRRKSKKKLDDRRIIDIYSYGDFEVVRFEPKGFSQRRPDGKGGYIWDLKGITPHLYHLADIETAVAYGETIFLPEGEKDTDNLWAIGAMATTNPMGAGAWRESYADSLTGANVVILPDRDTRGIAHAQEVAKSLYGKAASVKVLELPGKAKDVTEWIADGGDLDTLMALAAEVELYEPPTEPIVAIDPNRFSLTDTGNAERLIDRHGQDLRFNYERNKWLVWNGRLWEWDMGAKVMALAKETARSIYAEAANQPDDTKRKELANHAKKTEAKDRRLAMMVCAQSEPNIPVPISALDTDQWLLNCQNGTINLRTGELQPHNQQDLITIKTPIVYKPAAGCPLWHRFLDRVTGGSQELKAYLQRAVGYSLTGDTSDQVFFFVYGTGANGKSTFLNMVRKLTGDYGLQADSELFLVKDRPRGSVSEDVANLRGRRFVGVTEIEEGRRLSVVLVKAMTGGERLRASRKYEHEIEFQPTHKTWISGNHKPVILDTTLSIWRRIKQIPFTVVIPEAEQDKDLPIKLETELPGILAWAVQGCLDRQSQGLAEPTEVKSATSTYRQEQDILAEFLADCCLLKSTATVTKAALKDAYDNWCNENGAQPIKRTTFRARLAEKEVTEDRGTGGIKIWQGIGLISEVKSDQSDHSD